MHLDHHPYPLFKITFHPFPKFFHPFGAEARGEIDIIKHSFSFKKFVIKLGVLLVYCLSHIEAHSQVCSASLVVRL